MPQDVTPRWRATIASSHTVAIRCEVWDQGRIIGQVAPIDGRATDQWVTGVRRSLTLTLPSTDRRVVYPGVEIRPYRGIDYGVGGVELLPLGQFPITATDIGIRPDATISVSAQDKWTWIAVSTFVTPRASDVGILVRDQIARLIMETGQWGPADIQITATSTAVMTAQVWDSDRHAAIADLCELIGAEAFVTRRGGIVIRDRAQIWNPAATLSAPGQIVDGSYSISTADVANVVVATSNVTDETTKLDPYIARITDPHHPAYPRQGVPTSTARISGPWKTVDEQRVAAEKKLSAVAGPAEVIKATMLPDPMLDAADSVTIVLPGHPSRIAQLATITHPLTVGGLADIATVSPRSEDL